MTGARPESDLSGGDVSEAVAQNLKRLRDEQGLSLAQLSDRSGVSRAMLNQIERGKSTPTISVVWKIATAFGVPFSALLERTSGGAEVMRAERSWQLRSSDGRFTSRALFPLEGPRAAELYALRIEPGAVESSEPHRPGTIENLVVHAGVLVIGLPDGEHVLEAGDAIQFAADVPHRYAAQGEETVQAYLVMTYGR